MKDKELLQLLAQELGTTYKQLSDKSRKQPNPHKREICYFILKTKGYTVKEIGRLFNRDHSTIIHGLGNVRRKMQKDSDYKRFLYNLQPKYILNIECNSVNDTIIQDALQEQKQQIINRLREFKGYILNESVLSKL